MVLERCELVTTTAEDFRRERQVSHQAKPKKNQGFFDVRDVPRNAEEGAVDQLEHLGAHRHVAFEHSGNAGGAGFWVRQRFQEGAVVFGQRGERSDVPNDSADGVGGDEGVQPFGALEDVDEGWDVAGLGEVLVGHGKRANPSVSVCVARENDAGGAGLLLLSMLEHAGPVDAGHAQVTDDGVERLGAQEGDGFGASGGEGDFPDVALWAKGHSQGVEEARLVVDEEDAQGHEATLS